MKILIGMSGGLDSTYAAALLKSQGHAVLGAALVMHEYTEIAAATLAAEQVGIDLVTIDAKEAFAARVIDPFVQDYAAGRTPNPCVICNREVKFALLCDYAKKNGFDAVSTGHYSSILCENGRYFIRKAVDETKDQSYALWNLTQDELSMLHLPLAGAKKADVRAAASALGLSAADSAESMENCFIPDNDYISFLQARGVQATPGNFIDTQGNILGVHGGIIRYTIGQRKGLGIALGKPAFVTAIDPASNTVTLGETADLMTRCATITHLNFQKRTPAPGTFEASVKIRYAAPPTLATVTVENDQTTAQITFHTPVRAVTPGQSAVLYDGEDVLMGGVLIDAFSEKTS